MKSRSLICIAFISSAAFCMNLNEKKLSQNEIDELEFQYRKKWYHTEYARSRIFWPNSSPAELSKRCKREARTCNDLCNKRFPYNMPLTIPEVNSPDLTCGIIAELQRNIDCWFLHKKALISAAIGKH